MNNWDTECILLMLMLDGNKDKNACQKLVFLCVILLPFAFVNKDYYESA